MNIVHIHENIEWDNVIAAYVRSSNHKMKEPIAYYKKLKKNLGMMKK